MELKRADPLYQQIYRILRQQIIDGEFQAGESLSESRIAQSLDVSRTPVREALRQLASERLVVLRGFELTVANPTEQELSELYTCRAALEQVVAEAAVKQVDDVGLKNMQRSLEEAEQAIARRDHAQVFTANTQFHDHMVASSNMPLLAELLDTIRGPILIARRHVLNSSIEIENQILQEHKTLFEAITARDGEAAKIRMANHMQNDLLRGLQNFKSK